MRDVGATGFLATRRRTLRLAVGRIGLPAWFVAIDLLWIVKLDALAVDAEQ